MEASLELAASFLLIAIGGLLPIIVAGLIEKWREDDRWN